MRKHGPLTKDTITTKGFNLKPYIFTIGLLLFLYFGYHFYTSGRQLISIGVFALISGAILEARRLSEKWSPVLYTALIAFVLSLTVFLPGKRELQYDLDNHIKMWPYLFLLFFTIFAIVFYEDKITPRLTEGITLFQSVAVIYWVVDYGFINEANTFIKSLIAVGFFFSIFSFLHAFTHLTLSRTTRLILSIWSTIVMTLFAVDNILNVYKTDIENTPDLSNAVYVALQYFLLGISSIYIVQNIMMLLRFLPGKTTFFNKEYFEDLKRLKNEHVERYSQQQAKIIHSVFCIAFAGAIFIINYSFQIVQRHVAIWIVFMVFSFSVPIYEFFLDKKMKSAKTSQDQKGDLLR